MNCTYRHNNGENVKIFSKFSLHFDKEINSNTQDMEVLRIFQQPLKMARRRIEMRIWYSLHGCFWLAGRLVGWCTQRESTKCFDVDILFIWKSCGLKGKCQNRNIRLARQAPHESH